jgi:hypothetical protein
MSDVKTVMSLQGCSNDFDSVIKNVTRGNVIKNKFVELVIYVLLKFNKNGVNTEILLPEEKSTGDDREEMKACNHEVREVIWLALILLNYKYRNVLIYDKKLSFLEVEEYGEFQAENEDSNYEVRNFPEGIVLNFTVFENRNIGKEKIDIEVNKSSSGITCLEKQIVIWKVNIDYVSYFRILLKLADLLELHLHKASRDENIKLRWKQFDAFKLMQNLIKIMMKCLTDFCVQEKSEDSRLKFGYLQMNVKWNNFKNTVIWIEQVSYVEWYIIIKIECSEHLYMKNDNYVVKWMYRKNYTAVEMNDISWLEHHKYCTLGFVWKCDNRVWENDRILIWIFEINELIIKVIRFRSLNEMLKVSIMYKKYHKKLSGILEGYGNLVNGKLIICMNYENEEFNQANALGWGKTNNNGDIKKLKIMMIKCDKSRHVIYGSRTENELSNKFDGAMSIEMQVLILIGCGEINEIKSRNVRKDDMEFNECCDMVDSIVSDKSEMVEQYGNRSMIWRNVGEELLWLKFKRKRNCMYLELDVVTQFQQ